MQNYEIRNNGGTDEISLIFLLTLKWLYPNYKNMENELNISSNTKDWGNIITIILDAPECITLFIKCSCELWSIIQKRNIANLFGIY